MTNRQIGIAHIIAAVIFGAILLFSVLSCNSAAGQVNKPLTDSLPKQKVYSLTYERNYLYVNLDSLSAMGRYLGTAMTKDDWLQVVGIYNRVLGRVATMGRLDSTIVKQK